MFNDLFGVYIKSCESTKCYLCGTILSFPDFYLKKTLNGTFAYCYKCYFDRDD